MQQNENTKYSHAFENNLQLSKERGTSRHAVIWKKNKKEMFLLEPQYSIL